MIWIESKFLHRNPLQGMLKKEIFCKLEMIPLMILSKVIPVQILKLFIIPVNNEERSFFTQKLLKFGGLKPQATTTKNGTGF
jgi:hypothetical protein